ncbi:MAG: leucine-rich repeat domain-containing protein [Prevotella sp.]|nr:leucine-rich repeat domain-containing protein [Prevotella sp.]
MLRFNWTVSSQSSWAVLHITLDGEVIVSAGGENSGTYEKIIDGGQHILTATYSGPQATVKDISFITIDEVIAEKIAHVQEVAAANSHINKVLLEEANNYIAQISAGQYDKAKGIAVINKLEEYATRLAYLHLDISVPVQGAMGDSILAKVENFADVQSLRLTGKLNSDDIYSLKNRLTNLLELDLTGIDWMAIPNDQFRDKTNLTYVILPANVQSIGTDAFYNCQNLKHVTFPTTLKSIGEGAFYRTYNIGDVVLPEGLTSMSNYAFKESGLTSVTFPSTLKTISHQCFYNCDNLKAINFNGQTAISDEAFRYCDAITTLKFPETLTSIGNNAFYNCSRLNNIEFNEGLSNMGTDAFYNCDALQSVILPSTLISMHGAAFHNCDNLWQITCRSIAPPVATNYNVADKSVMTLYVPQLSVNVYKQTLHWDVFDIKGVDIMPDNITIVSDYNLNWADSLSLDYKPNVYITTMDYSKFGSLSVNGNSTLSAGNFFMYWDENVAYYDTSWDSERGRYYYNRNRYASFINNATARADNVSIYLSLKANRWAFLTIPYDVKVSDIQENWEGTPLAIRKYDGEKRAAGLTGQTWVDITADSTLHAGQGYIWRSASTDNNRDYTGFTLNALQTVNKNNLFANGDLEIPLAYYESEFPQNRSWNLIGNPYPCFYDIRAMQTSAPITIWNNYYQNYEAFSPQDDAYILNPGQAFFVQCPVDEERITFLREGRQTNTTVRDITYDNSARPMAPTNVQRSVFNVILSNGEQADRTRFIINTNATTAYEQGRDASKFASLVAVPQLYTIENDVQFAINERPFADGKVMLGMQIVKEGTYTLKLDTKVDNEVWLIDNLTGNEVLFSDNEEGYTFSSNAGTFDSRFMLRIGNGETTGIDEIVNSKSSNSKWFDLQGRRVNNTQKGIYIKDGRKVLR